MGIGRVSPRGVKLITHLHLVPGLRMTGATSPLFHTPSWCGKAAVGWNCEVHTNGATRAVRSALWDQPSIWKCFDRFVRSQDLPAACRPLTSRPTFSCSNPNGGPHMCSCLFLIDLFWKCYLSDLFLWNSKNISSCH